VTPRAAHRRCHAGVLLGFQAGLRALAYLCLRYDWHLL
jgi:hypothetical protein